MKSLFVKGGIVLDSPLHVGSGSPSAIADSAVVRDHHGRPYVPGTSLVGVLRALARRLVRNGHMQQWDLDWLFGTAATPGGDADTTTPGRAAALHVRDALLETDSLPPIRARDHVAIDRETGAAEPHKLFSEEIIPRGCKFSLYLRVDIEDDNNLDSAKKALLALLGAASKRMRLGGKTASGLGVAHIEVEEARLLDWSNPQHLAQFAASEGLRPMAGDCLDLNFTESPEDSFICYKLFLVPVEPLLVASAVPREPTLPLGTQTEHEQMLNTDFGDIEFDSPEPRPRYLPRDPDKGPYREQSATGSFGIVIPGSSLKGPLRDRGEKILRALGAEALVAEVFGDTGQGSRLFVSDALPVCPKDFEQGLKLFDHVAIDRFTGGVAGARKFDQRAYVPEAGDLGACLSACRTSRGALDTEIELDIGTASETDAKWMHGLLLFMLRDLAQGRIRIGSKKAIGFGKVAVLFGKSGCDISQAVFWDEFYEQNKDEFHAAVAALLEKASQCEPAPVEGGALQNE